MAIYAVTAGNTALAADLNQYKALLVDGTDTTTKLGIGATSTQAAVNIALPQTASAAIGAGLRLSPTLTAAANGDALVAFYSVAPTYAIGTLTGTTLTNTLIDGSGMSKTGAASPGTVYGLYVSSPTIGSTNWAAALLGHIKSGGGTPTATAGTGVTSATVTGNDTAGYVTVVTSGSPPIAGATVVTLNFATSYGSAPASAIVTDGTSAAAPTWFVSPSSGYSGGSLVIAGKANLAATTTYYILYVVIG